MRVFYVALMLFFSGCSVSSLIPGQVVHHTVTCTDPTVCKERMANDCPNGGVLYSIKQAVEVEYSCNP